MKPVDPLTGAKAAAAVHLDGCLSTYRMAPYHAAAATAGVSGIEVYTYNMALAAALLGPLHVTEVVLRNAMHGALTTRFGREDWWDSSMIVLAQRQRESIDGTVQNTFVKFAKLPARPTTDDIVAASDFGFWTGFADDGPATFSYEKELWDQGLKAAFPNLHRTRKQFRLQLDGVRRLRNRVGHHEPFHHDKQRVEERYKDALLVIATVSPEVARWVNEASSVRRLLAMNPTDYGPMRF